MEGSGYVYILTNESMPGIVKIGMSRRGGTQRANELYSGSTGLPTPFVLFFEILCNDPEEVEENIFEEYEKYRVNKSREFFRVCEHEAKRLLMDHVAVEMECTIVGIEDHLGPPEIYPLCLGFEELTGEKFIIPEFVSILWNLKPEDILAARDRWEKRKGYLFEEFQDREALNRDGDH